MKKASGGTHWISLYEWRLFATASKVSTCSSPLHVASTMSCFCVKLVLCRYLAAKKETLDRKTQLSFFFLVLLIMLLSLLHDDMGLTVALDCRFYRLTAE